jgi:L-asparaginase II
MTRYPKHIGGKGRFDTDFITTLGGRAVSKIGSEGVRGIGIRTEAGKHVGVAIKVLGDNLKALNSMSVAILKHLRLLDEEALLKLDKYYNPALKSYSDQNIGHIETEISIEEQN